MFNYLGGNLLWAKNAFGDAISWQAGLTKLLIYLNKVYRSQIKKAPISESYDSKMRVFCLYRQNNELLFFIIS